VKFSPLLLAVSFMITRLGRGWAEKAGSVLHALSLILIGMFLLKLGADPLLSNPAVRGAVASVALRPFTMFLTVLLGTAILQSSSSVMALAVAIAMSGALPQSAVFPIALGSHLGSTVTMLLAAMGGRRNARLLGVATFLYKLAGVAALAPFAPWANDILSRLGFSTPANLVLAQVFLVSLNAALFYPWPQILIHSGTFALSHMQAADLGAPFFLDDSLIGIPSLSVRLLSKEMVRLTNYIEALLQMRIFPDKNGGELQELLPNGIKELTEACEQYMYAIQPPSIAEDRATGREYRSISYAMLSLREAAHLATDRIRENTSAMMRNRREKAEWEKMTSFFMETVRDAFHAFALGDGDLAQRAIAREADFEKFTRFLRAHLLAGDAGRRENSALVEIVAVTRRFLHAAIEVALGGVSPETIGIEALRTEDEIWEKEGDRFGQE
jgi:phosphate:Na+ symporter